MRFVPPRSRRLLVGALVLGAALTGCGVPGPEGTAPTTTDVPSERTSTTVARPAFVPPDCSVPREPPPPASADRIGPLLAVRGRTYWARGVQLPVASAGAVVGRTCRLDEGGSVELLDGDSPYPAGTELLAVAGYDPRFRLGIVDGDRLVVFELFYDGGARTGADLYDLSSGVDAVEIRTFESDELITTWADERVRTIVDAIDAAPIDRRPTDGIVAYRLRFRMRDGSPVDAVYNPRNGRLQDLQLGPDVAALFADLPRPATPTPTTAPALAAPPTTVAAGPIGIDQVRRLADALGVVGDIEEMPGELGAGHCINRLGPAPTLCVDVPLWGLWQYADLEAQSLPSATEDEARAAASALLERLGLPPDLGEIGSNGAQITVAMRVGGSVVVAEGGRIAQVIAPTSMLPTG